MREHLALVAALAVAGAAPARAEPHAKPRALDISASRARLDVYKDDHNMFYVSPHSHDPGIANDDQLVFFGDGKTMYQQRVLGMMAGDSGYAWTLWAPRALGLPAARLVLDSAPPQLGCKRDDARTLKQLPGDQANQILAHATFLPPLWEHQARLLARDDDGVYYYVDSLLDDLGGAGHRIYVGLKGAMKELPVNRVSDSAGELYTTKVGSLKVSADKIEWIKNGTRMPLTQLEPSDNRYLIYRELGIYGALGAVCDDQ